MGSKEFVDSWSEGFLDEEQLDELRQRPSAFFSAFLRADLMSSFDNPFIAIVPTLRPV